MPNSRLIHQKIVDSKQVHDLSNDTSRLAFTWLLTFTDREGRAHGDPIWLRNKLFPRRENITTEQMRGYVSEWHEAELVIWYRAKGDLWIYFPSFFEHQKGFDKRNEPISTIPDPPPWAPGGPLDVADVANSERIRPMVARNPQAPTEPLVVTVPPDLLRDIRNSISSRVSERTVGQAIGSCGLEAVRKAVAVAQQWDARTWAYVVKILNQGEAAEPEQPAAPKEPAAPAQPRRVQNPVTGEWEEI